MSEILERLDEMNDSGVISYGAYSELYDLASKLEEHKEGKWINGDPICPCCGKSKFEDLEADIWADWQPKFCPNCGAKMGVNK